MDLSNQHVTFWSMILVFRRACDSIQTGKVGGDICWRLREEIVSLPWEPEEKTSFLLWTAVCSRTVAANAATIG